MPTEATATAAKAQAAILAHPAIHILIYGDPGSMKTTFATTAPTPQLWFVFDAPGKELPLWRRFSAKKGYTAIEGETPEGMEMIQFFKGGEKGKLVAQVEFYRDSDPEAPDAWAAFRDRARRWSEEEAHQRVWATVILDSINSMRGRALAEQQYVIAKLPEGKSNPRFEKRRKLDWRAGVTDELEHQLINRFGYAPGNVIVIGHTEEKNTTFAIKDDEGGNPAKNKGLVEMWGDEMFRTLAAPGRLASQKILLATYSEVYRAYVTKKGKEKSYHIQTENDGEWVAHSQHDAPDGCEPTWKAAMVNLR